MCSATKDLMVATTASGFHIFLSFVSGLFKVNAQMAKLNSVLLLWRSSAGDKLSLKSPSSIALVRGRTKGRTYSTNS